MIGVNAKNRELMVFYNLARGFNEGWELVLALCEFLNQLFIESVEVLRGAGGN